MTNITDEQRKEALGWAEKIYSFCGDCYNCPHLDEGCESARNTIRSALEPKVVTISEVRELLSCYRHVHSVDIYKLDEAQERAVIKKLAELGITVKEEKQ